MSDNVQYSNEVRTEDVTHNYELTISLDNGREHILVLDDAGEQEFTTAMGRHTLNLVLDDAHKNIHMIRFDKVQYFKLRRYVVQ